MTRILTLIVLLFANASFGQTETKRNCKIEIYLLVAGRPNVDSSLKLGTDTLSIDIFNLADTAFIKDSEILSCTFKSDTFKLGNEILTARSLRLKLAPAATTRMSNLRIPFSGGRQFAFVVNGNIAYAGYFWNRESEFARPLIGVTAFAYDTRIDMFLREPPENPIVLNCLRESTEHTH